MNLFSFVLFFVLLRFGLSKQCSRLFPTLGRIARGVDITELDLFPPLLLAPNGFRQSVFELTCDLNRSWSHPDHPNLSFNLPDQIAIDEMYPDSLMTADINIYPTLITFKKSLSNSIVLNEENTGLFGSFSRNIGFEDAQKQMMKLDKSIAKTFAFVHFIKANLINIAKMKLNSKFLDYTTNILPEKYEQNPKVYHEFLHTFGTYYFESATFGGAMMQNVLIRNDYLYKQDKPIVDNIKHSLLNLIDYQNATIDEQFKANSENYQRANIFGGFAEPRHFPRYLPRWWDSIHRDPWLIGAQLKCIDSLILNATIKSQVSKAIQIRRVEALYSELTRNLQFSGVQNELSQTSSETLLEIQQYLTKQSYALDKLNEIGKRINELNDEVHQLKDQSNREKYRKPVRPIESLNFLLKRSDIHK